VIYFVDAVDARSSADTWLSLRSARTHARRLEREGTHMVLVVPRAKQCERVPSSAAVAAAQQMQSAVCNVSEKVRSPFIGQRNPA